MSSLRKLFGAVIICLFLVSGLSAEEYGFLLEVRISERILVLHEMNQGETEEAERFPVAVPAYTGYLPLPLTGEVKRIQINPWWYPTPGTRAAYLKKNEEELPAVIEPGNPKNALGEAKIEIDFENFNLPIRIHGTNDPDSIGKRITRGCIRMRNEDILSLIKIIRGGKTRIIFVA